MEGGCGPDKHLPFPVQETSNQGRETVVATPSLQPPVPSFVLHPHQDGFEAGLRSDEQTSQNFLGALATGRWHQLLQVDWGLNRHAG